MSEHLNDPRVRQVGGQFFVVTGSLDEYEVMTFRGEWLTTSMTDRPHGSDEVEAWAWVERNAVRRPSLDEALTYALARVGAA